MLIWRDRNLNKIWTCRFYTLMLNQENLKTYWHLCLLRKDRLEDANPLGEMPSWSLSQGKVMRTQNQTTKGSQTQLDWNASASWGIFKNTLKRVHLELHDFFNVSLYSWWVVLLGGDSSERPPTNVKHSTYVYVCPQLLKPSRGHEEADCGFQYSSLYTEHVQ